MSNCPPAPTHIREQGISDCDYLQKTPFQRDRLKENYLSNTVDFYSLSPIKNYYSIGEYPMRHNPHCMSAYVRSNPMHVGRSVLDIEAAKRYNTGNVVQPLDFTMESNYSSMGDENFIKDLWSAQLIALWISDGAIFANQFPSMQNIVSLNGHEPDSLVDLELNEDGQTTLDVIHLLNPDDNQSMTFVKGPDGMFGLAAQSLLESWAKNRNLFGYIVPPQGEQVFDRLTQGIVSETILSDAPAPSVIAKTPCNQMILDARSADPDCPPINVPEEVYEEELLELIGGEGQDNSMSWVYLLGAAVAVGGLGYYIHKRS